jgi:hypothetical protein
LYRGGGECKAILKENGYPKQGDWTMNDYKKIEDSHRLSAFRVKVPSWRGTRNIRMPFATLAFQPRKTPCWYMAYNDTKHDRHVNFARANLGNVLRHEFDPTSFPIRPDNDSDLFYPAQWSLFGVRFPDDWPPEQHYDLTNWEYTQPNPFQHFPYCAARPHPGHRGKPRGTKTTTHGNR